MGKEYKAEMAIIEDERLALYGYDGRILTLAEIPVLEEKITNKNIGTYQVHEIEQLLFKVSRGGKTWIIGTDSISAMKNSPERINGKWTLNVFSNKYSTIIIEGDEYLMAKRGQEEYKFEVKNKTVKLLPSFYGVKAIIWTRWGDKKYMEKMKFSNLKDAFTHIAHYLNAPIYHSQVLYY